ncbi:heterokaryon incompatibility protein-domain-containing protein [Xylariomycetidae sp. FL2044]|nr:heterokaryon incompatibility protein-domain-containing protein [Xylariomycetidae sp. FL2044]
MTSAAPVTNQSHDSSYKPLGSTQIRLLQFRRGEEDLLVHLENVELSRRNFTTISYAWGEDQVPMFLQNDEGRVTKKNLPRNVLKALKMLESHRENSHEYVWLDFICINQDDRHGKMEQIDLMGRIFRDSNESIVWLGPEADDSDKAIQLLHQLASKRKCLKKMHKDHDKRGMSLNLA